ncbi:DUF928 domain-containing protein [Fortiea sp. LEGE XX443]|uniref:DUF928 domain-containing protein n=1 Tax=Fortiea sp. LEGE XX443 TaxID=1828611 RepID=UPI00187F5B1C|nr:DUF928 domain-containing protein [Fortiea sp. LEGE XX443]MBE9007820.1 DUF928 domain-containing protein [Fortiea sp. LEGE XX443]
MICPKLQKIGITVLVITVGLTGFLPVNTAVARTKIIFVPPILSSPRRLIPAGTRVYEPSSGEDTGIIPEVQPASPIQRLPDAFNGVGNIRRPVQRKAPQNEDRGRSSVPVANQCLQGKLPLTALIPESQLGLTTLANPALFFYVPQTSAPELELVVQNENEQEVYIQKYKPSNKAGIISLRLPVNSLAVNKQYKWKLSLICNPTDKSQNKVVAGLVQRVLPDQQLVKKLQQATRQERAVLYAAAGIWHDALASVAQIRYLLPNNQGLASDWEGLLTARNVGLNRQIAQQPLILVSEILQPKKKHKF